METNKQLTDRLQLMGCKARFIPFQESEAETTSLETRRPAEIIDGRLVGSEIDLYDRATFRIWTPRTKAARACAARYNLRICNLDGECELFIPTHLADELLPKLGAKVKRSISEATRAKLKAYWFKKTRARMAL